MQRFRYYFTIAKLAFLVITPIVLLILPADFFDQGESVCLSKVIFDVECFACGLTRACMHLIHLEFEEAFAYHMFSFIAFPALAAYWVYWFLKERKAFLKMRAAMRLAVQQA
ncbi:DUF2752 domain-containing protein [Paraflavitalea sp. CAU 1676]|uniref:DUF2752 domain-containing protein n=1 Tax=Paraflavitalea sp. CAU 1676 TaxID=3032598 RepID=UPI0023DA1BDE|nr:DUF2752 domain-containing protein [Paraflavitalea sp. CAU 1676]MDF2191954.1 DUF2752 domain-containing protein [Paraflavitalea sp. CAU 1676]